jgi:hypothetical protein
MHCRQQSAAAPASPGAHQVQRDAVGGEHHGKEGAVDEQVQHVQGELLLGMFHSGELFRNKGHSSNSKGGEDAVDEQVQHVQGQLLQKQCWLEE